MSGRIQFGAARVVTAGPVPSGVADGAALQAASDAVAARATGAVAVGGTLQLRAGTYYVDSTWLFSQQEITVKGVGPATVLKWSGAAGRDIINVRDSSRVTFSDMTILGDVTNPPSAGIYYESPTTPVVGTNEYLVVERIMFGRRYTTERASTAPYPMAYGVRIGGATIGNNDTLRLSDLVLQDATVAGVYIANEQNRWNVLENLTFNQCATGLYCSGHTAAMGLWFNRSSVVDIYVTKCQLDIYGMASEHAVKVWDQQNLSSLTIHGGTVNLQTEIGAQWASSFLAGAGYQQLTLLGLSVLDQAGTNPKLYIHGSSSNTVPAYVFIRGGALPNGDSDAGYTIDGYNPGTPLHIDIQQGVSYWRRQVVQSLNAASSWANPVPAPQISDFTTSGTWTKPANAVRVRVFAVGGGGGGGSGRRGAAGTVRCGGGSGAGGCAVTGDFLASDLGATEAVTIGAAGPGGAAQTVDSTDGNVGTGGGTTVFGSATNRWLVAYQGGGGGGGTATTGTAGSTGAPGGSVGVAASTTGLAGGTSNVGPSRGSATTAGAGGSGGGLTTGNAESAGGTGALAASGGNTAPIAGIAGGGAGNPGTDARLPILGGGGGSGGGSAASGSTPGGAGGNGGNYGGGGGGGGASTNGANSGKGGDGAGGFVRVVTYFE